jgi:L-seryl-tRNA(Ser) seleniumtransferase
MDIYERLGVRKAISCCGTFTILGGALMDPRVLEAMQEASRSHVHLPELQRKAGERIAALIGVEAAFITTGASGGLMLSSAALLAGSDPARMSRLPDTTGMRHEVVICKCHRFNYDQAVRAAGATFVEIGHGSATRAWQMEAAIGDNTAFAFWVAEHNTNAALPFETFVRIAHERNIPVLVDNAAEVPPVSNLRKFNEMGADLVVISGGKGLRGPQSAGLILGRKELIEACRANSSPNDYLGRPLKVGKEEICGMVAAVELYLTDICRTERLVWERMVEHIVGELRGLPGVTARRHFPYNPSRQVPVAAIELGEGARCAVPEVLKRLQEGDPPIYAPAPATGFGYRPGNGFIINPHTMLEGEERIVARRLREILGG